MKRLLSSLLLAALSATAVAQSSSVSVDGVEDVAQYLTAVSLKRNVAASDASVVRTRAWLDKVMKVSGEEEKSIAAACERTAHWFFDVTRVRATSLEMLEALVLHGRAGTSIQDTLGNYVSARRQAADNSHAAALAAMAKK